MAIFPMSSGGEIHPYPFSLQEGDPLDDALEIEEQDLPSASDVANIFLGGLLLLASLAACYFAATIVLPIILAFVLMLVLQPVMRQLSRLRIPRGIAAVLVLVAFFGFSLGWARCFWAPQRVGLKNCHRPFPSCKSG
jgi:hypothetical protein